MVLQIPALNTIERSMDMVERSSAKSDSGYVSQWNMTITRLKKNRRAVISFYVLCVIILLILLVPVVSPYDILDTNLNMTDQPPSASYWFGTDNLGRDLFTRLWAGGRMSLLIAIAVVFLEVIIGIVLGSVSGYYGGRTDSVIMRITEIFMCFPFLMICITIIAIFGSSVRNLVLVLALLGWPGIARIVRGQILSLKELEFMEACEALGISDSKRIFKHLLPNVMASVIVFSTLGMASVILTETALSFLGLGVSATTPTWGNMIQIARNLYIIQGRAWQWIPPGVAIFVTVLAFNLLGDGLRDALDPKLKQ
jgi:peptide/nickel transport system permease protein